MVSDALLELIQELCRSLNPCSNGIWSLTKSQASAEEQAAVLILVLMEYGL